MVIEVARALVVWEVSGGLQLRCAGLVVGAVLGLLFTVLFEDGLRRIRTAASTRFRRLRARGRLPNPTAEFARGPLQTSVVGLSVERNDIDETPGVCHLDPFPATRPQVVFTKRSSDVGAFPGRWDASANEALSRSLDSRGRAPPSLYDVARRGLREELAL